MASPPRGTFIVLEGGDGAGKTTLLRSLTEALAATGRSLLVTREPGGTEEGQALRAMLLPETGKDWEPAAELLLMTAARVQHVRRVIRPALDAGHIVLCDRFVGSTLAYQGGGSQMPVSEILYLHRRLVGNPWPDLTLLLDIDPEQGLARGRARQAAASADEGRFEARGLDFHRRVREAYLHLARTRRGWTVLDAAADPASVTRQALAAVLSVIGEDGRPGQSPETP
jgi:dTMP kinase